MHYSIDVYIDDINPTEPFLSVKSPLILIKLKTFQLLSIKPLSTSAPLQTKGASCHFVMKEKHLTQILSHEQLEIMLVDAKTPESAKILAQGLFPMSYILQSRPEWVSKTIVAKTLSQEIYGDIKVVGRLCTYGKKLISDFDQPLIQEFKPEERCRCGLSIPHVCDLEDSPLSDTEPTPSESSSEEPPPPSPKRTQPPKPKPVKVEKKHWIPAPAKTTPAGLTVTKNRAVTPGEMHKYRTTNQFNKFELTMNKQ
ncbi:hypothetical protein BLNAU_12637 [Blattamonas nauphoetae]|uniref:Uncharacterized protein n=1 Tax=Blattamonas nauphoetae TaxID=2049346 RepID=A0ABQ9XQI1_9EUKA|nr:hypothetical protein BLNAU_12637 [Blattamonas nauphoetae]